MKSRIDAVSLLVILLVIVSGLPIIFGGVSFDRQEVNLSDNDESSAASNALIDSDSNPTILANLVANGSNVYVVWYNHTSPDTSCSDNSCDVIFLKSANNGTSFSDPIKLGTSTSDSPHPMIAVGDKGHIYVTWQDGTDIRISVSDNSAQDFTVKSAVDIGDAPSVPGTLDKAAPQILANKTGGNVYVGWTASDTRFKLVTSNDFGKTFSTASDIGIVGRTEGEDSVAQDKNILRLAANQSHIFVVTQESSNIIFKSSGSNGTAGTFQINKTIGSTTAENLHGFPHVVANETGSEVYVTWRDDKSYKFTQSEDANSFSSEFTLGLNNLTTGLEFTSYSEIALGELGRVFVVWTDQASSPDVVRFRNSTDEGNTFSDSIKMSGSTTQRSARIASSDGSVFIVFREDSSDKDRISLVTSIDNGLTLGSKSFLTSDNAENLHPQVDAVNDKAYFIWESHPTTTTTASGEINFTSATSIPVTITYNETDNTNFRISEKAKITINSVNDASSSTINVPIQSDTDSSGISVSLSETDSNTGIFTGTFSFTSGSGSSSDDSGDILRVKPGDTITATHRTVGGTSKIFPVTFTFNSTSYNLGNAPSIHVVDQNSNLDSTKKETVTVSVKATNTEDTASLTLTETGVNTGQFGDSTDTSKFNLILVNASDTDTPIDRSLTISAETSTVAVVSTSDPSGLDDLTLTDSDGDGIFTGTLNLGTTTSASSRTIKVATCDILDIKGNGGSSGINARRLVTPCSDATKEPISVDVRVNLAGSTTQKDFLVATLREVSSGATDTQIIAGGGEKGGGGGGLVRPTVVLNAIAGAAAIFGTGGGADSSPPASTLDILSKAKTIDIPDHIRTIIENHDPNVPLEPIEDELFDLPLQINNRGYPLSSNENTIVTDKVEVGEPVQFKMTFYEQRDLWHVSIYLNIRDGMRDDQSDTFILFDKDEPLTIKDKNGFFENVDFEIIEDENNKKFAIFDITFAKPMETSDFVYKAWDFDRQGTAVKVKNAIQVGEIPKEEPVNKQEPEPVESQEPVPEWVKNTAKWWADDQIDDKTFTNGIGFLISENIIDVPVKPNIGEVKEDEPGIEPEEEPTVMVPEWVKNTAKWWAEDQIDEDTFLSGIEFLVKEGIIVVVPG